MKRLVLFLDGTWNDDRDGETPTNVVRLRQAVEAANRRPGATPQRIYYDTGVGTHGLVDRVLGGTLGAGLSENVRQAYRFLSQFYEPGSEIFIFGFSRGAFTARSLAGFAAASGLLTPANCTSENLERAWQYYRTPPKQRFPAEKAQLDQLCASGVRIRFLGVFDTVGSLGIPLGLAGNWAGSGDRFHDTKLGSAVDYAYQALAIDEHRGPFVPALWARPDHNNNRGVEQVWFPGVHSDVGGGFSRKADVAADRTPICDLTLTWMAQRATEAGLDLDLGDTVAAPPGTPHEHYGFFLYSKAVPMHRRIAEAGLKPVPTSPHHTYMLAPPERSYMEFLHVSVLDLMIQTRADHRRADYRPRNVVGALPLVKAGSLKLIGYGGAKLSEAARDDLLAQLPPDVW